MFDILCYQLKVQNARVRRFRFFFELLSFVWIYCSIWLELSNHFPFVIVFRFPLAIFRFMLIFFLLYLRNCVLCRLLVSIWNFPHFRAVLFVNQIQFIFNWFVFFSFVDLFTFNFVFSVWFCARQNLVECVGMLMSFQKQFVVVCSNAFAFEMVLQSRKIENLRKLNRNIKIKRKTKLKMFVAWNGCRLNLLNSKKKNNKTKQNLCN